MNVTTQDTLAVKSGIAPIIAAAFFLGFAMLYVAGFAQSAVLHNAAHDVRHAAGFPCH